MYNIIHEMYFFDFSDYLTDNPLYSTNNKHNDSYICGDFNVNLLNVENDNMSNLFSEMWISHSFYPPITHPTRISNNSSTLIDNIFTNVLTKKFQVELW